MTLHFNFLKKGKAMKSDNENNLFAKLVYGDLSEVQALLESEIHPDEYKDEYGNTALFNTLFLGDLKRAKLLLTHNSSPNIKDNYGQTILDKLVSSNSMGNPPQKQSTKGVEFSRNKEGDSINDNIKAQ